MKEKEPVRQKITYEEFLANLLMKRELFKSLCLDGALEPEVVRSLNTVIDDTILTVNIAMNSDLRVKFYKDEEDEVFFAIEEKGKLGFLKN